MELFGPSLAEQIRKHQLHLHEELTPSWLPLFQIQLHPEVPNIIQLDFLLAVAYHECARVEGEERLVQLGGEDVVVLQVALLFQQFMLLVVVRRGGSGVGGREELVAEGDLGVEDRVGLGVIELKKWVRSKRYTYWSAELPDFW